MNLLVVDLLDRGLDTDRHRCHDRVGFRSAWISLGQSYHAQASIQNRQSAPAIVVFGIGIAALRESSDLWASGVFTFTLSALLISIVLAIHRTESRRAFWIGFALFRLGLFGALLGPIDRAQANHD